jgi:hypothetical protein
MRYNTWYEESGFQAWCIPFYVSLSKSRCPGRIKKITKDLSLDTGFWDLIHRPFQLEPSAARFNHMISSSRNCLRFSSLHANARDNWVITFGLSSESTIAYSVYRNLETISDYYYILFATGVGFFSSRPELLLGPPSILYVQLHLCPLESPFIGYPILTLC